MFDLYSKQSHGWEDEGEQNIDNRSYEGRLGAYQTKILIQFRIYYIQLCTNSYINSNCEERRAVTSTAGKIFLPSGTHALPLGVRLSLTKRTQSAST